MLTNDIDKSLCPKCQALNLEQLRRTLKHHHTWQDLKTSAANDCGLCTVLWQGLLDQSNGQEATLPYMTTEPGTSIFLDGSALPKIQLALVCNGCCDMIVEYDGILHNGEHHHIV